MTNTVTLPFADYKPSWPRSDADEVSEAASRILGLARIGCAATDNDSGIDLEKSGYEQLFETIAIIADGMLEPIEDLTKMAGLGMWGPKTTDPTPVDELLAKWRDTRRTIEHCQSAFGEGHEASEGFKTLEGTASSLAASIAGTTPTTLADATAMLQWAEEDGAGEFLEPLHTKARAAVIAFLNRQPATAIAAE